MSFLIANISSESSKYTKTEIETLEAVMQFI